MVWLLQWNNRIKGFGERGKKVREIEVFRVEALWWWNRNIIKSFGV